MGYVQTMAPELLAEKQFIGLLSTFIRNLLEQEFGWSWRSGTRAAHKVPLNWEDKCEDMFLRMVYYMRTGGIPPEAVVNADQMGLCLMPVGNQTWAPRGARQVDVVGKEEKRQLTVMVATSCTGEILPMQCIWTGKTPAALPSANSRAPAEQEGFLFTPGGKNHWSSVASMKAVSPITLGPFEPSSDSSILRLPKPVGLLSIDCWKVHRSVEFREMMKRDYKWIKLAFIPGGCSAQRRWDTAYPKARHSH
ncbi:hypothetical protein DFP72DRAFT_991082 [Ephemerocybe angulata]|uniref:DDE-1 domain-containing protein n=1 Tax=Ephemerocybe angulata TaxID=980116 RepID=A0A8H6M532_9AGAR|nr:hypothetical protein DFP72DRAFT_991082 [Tulosesus angulatus]